MPPPHRYGMELSNPTLKPRQNPSTPSRQRPPTDHVALGPSGGSTPDPNPSNTVTFPRVVGTPLDAMAEKVMTARFNLTFDPEGFGLPGISSVFPALDVRIISLFPLGNSLAVMDLEIRGDLSDPRTGATIVEQSRPNVVEVLDQTAQRLLIRLTTRAGVLIDTLQSLGVAPVLPIPVLEGRMSVTVRASRVKIQRIFGLLRERKVDVLLSHITEGSVKRGPHAGLTPRQLDLYRMARSSGYWDTPRRTTLTDIATIMGLSKSAVSETLAKVERKVLTEGLNPLEI